MNMIEQVMQIGWPCYLSFEWAMFYHDLIDQPLYVVQCATLRDGFRTQIGSADIEFITLSEDYFFGFDNVKDPVTSEEFRLASPEKSLLDYLLKQRNEGYSPDLLFFVDWERLDIQKLFQFGEAMEPWLSRDMAFMVRISRGVPAEGG